nr:disease resistance protein RGA2-like isoform X1 [Ziziphus jujuba var. spinosa]XP_048329171.1 disease resistance protein RGA2-like isoform X1 [Ziziphus jujuba var. spinosa]XP_048329172.1 disease resistance protein RGA2-like isoform X1 [Ziziphus jujuba var. spinosa]XP_048329173.1 disease resistance protein RGA2-like isoform X1 [Ziziphus jujuba var. spinosa]XP_048329174.1 disease resistance protein RGA2-like isoform X1 [Ziziphus jujuba var. spinosa]XP_048329175.1 disease resistance protein RGA
MAEPILSGITEGIIGQLTKAAVKEIALLWGVEDELDQLEDTIKTIKSVLADAEKKQVQSEQIKTWLERLEDAVYEADDLVDEFSTEALRQQVMTGNIMAKQVRTFFSTNNQLAFRHRMGKKIRDLTKKLDKTAKNRHDFSLDVDLQDIHIMTPTVREEDVVGRDDDKMKIIKLLFEMETEKNIGIIPIVGVGGLGKTTFAQQVIKDSKVKDHFEPIMWVDVPKVFHVESVVKEIINPGVKDERKMHQLRNDLEKKIKGKQYLLVLDDVWGIDNREKWLELENLLRDGASGSRIIVTTREENSAHNINGREGLAHFLGTLVEEKSWSLFEKLAFKQGQEPNDGNLVEIGKEIASKCGGIPLVIRTIATMLFSIKHEEWSSFKEKELLTIHDYQNDVLRTLKLSYDYLPSHLKHCFGYCSLFPKNHVFDVEMLINLWMAQGFIKLSNDHNQCLEDMGYQHFKDLLYRSFFEVVEIDDDSSKVTKCKMHDCMHDLATSVIGTKGLILSPKDEKIDKRTRHVSFCFTLEPLQVQALLVNAKKIRTIFKRDRYYDLSYRVLEESILKCKFLRTLDLQYSSLKRLPASIGKLKHLRYLDLSKNKMKALPNSITRLQNLQTLNVSYCENLQEIPSGITKMFNLRHLHIESDSGTTLHGMPGGLDQLTNLQRLSLLPQGYLWNQWIPLNNESFFLHHISNWKTLDMMDIDDLQHLPDGLKSFTCLQKLSISRCSKLESLSPGLNHLTSLQQLKISRCSKLKSLSPGLNHLTSLQRLKIGFCDKLDMSNGGSDATIPWQRFQSLSVLRLCGLPKLVALPEGLQQLTTLQEIRIFKCKNLEFLLEYVINLKKLYVVDCPKLKSLPEGIGSLETLEIRICPILLERCRDDIGDYWPLICNINQLILSPVGREAEFSRGEGVILLEYQSIPMNSESFFYHYLSKLKSLTLQHIEDLQHLPDGLKRLTSLETLDIRNCSKLQSLSPGLYHLTSLKQLYIHRCEEVEMPNDDGSDAIMWQHLQSLSELTLRGLPKLVALPQGLQQLTTLQIITIHGCENLEAVLENISNLKSLKKLYIRNCPKLKSLPEGIDCLTSLETLRIRCCPILLERCQEDKGDYWPKISHIKQLELEPIEEEHKTDPQEESSSSKTRGLFNCAKIFKH